jgi:hypothetical protein
MRPAVSELSFAGFQVPACGVGCRDGFGRYAGAFAACGCQRVRR